MTVHRFTGRALLGAVLLTAGIAGAAEPAAAQWSRTYEQFYLPAKHNWEFRKNYVSADRLFNAFDYGHSILYEELYTKPGAPVERLEEKEFNFLVNKVLRNPPRVPLEEGAIEIAYAKLAPEAKEMFHWAHILHRQAYDIWADERLSPEQKDRAMTELLAYYKSRPDVAFSSLPKSMELMDGQYYSLAFREKYPKFNGLIWAYHWLQVGLYEPLLVGQTPAEKKALVDATVARFWQMIQNAPDNMPYLMPMTAAVAPEFSKRYPEMAIIFDNLHMMHDVISDILASPKVPREKKRGEILKAARLFSDNTSYVTTVDEWWEMARMMGLNNMGGPSVGFLAALPEPSVPRGMSMAGMDHSQMAGMQHGPMQHAQPGAQLVDHAAMGHAMPQGAAQPDEHAGHRMPATAPAMHEMYTRMVADPVIHQRIMQDTALHRMMMEHMQHMPAENRAQMHQMMHGESHGHPVPSARKPAPAPAKKPAARKAAPAPKKADPHAGHGAAKPAAKAPAKKPAAKPTSKPAAKPKPAANPKDPHAGHHMPPAHKHP